VPLLLNLPPVELPYIFAEPPVETTIDGCTCEENEEERVSEPLMSNEVSVVEPDTVVVAVDNALIVEALVVVMANEPP
jgi:hypothetical protein